MSWASLLVYLASSIALTILYQIVMYLLSRLIVYISLLGIVGIVGYFTYTVIYQANGMDVVNQDYY